MRWHTTVAALLASVLVVPVFLGQGQVESLEDALAGTRRALEVLKGLEERLRQDPDAAMNLVLASTEPPSGDEEERDRRLETLRDEVNLLQMELDALSSPVLAPDGAVQGALGTQVATDPRSGPAAGVTTGLDDSLRALLAVRAPLRSQPRAGTAGSSGAPTEDPTAGASEYSADPLRHGVALYRAGRYAEALERLVPLDDAQALYWQARALEHLERLDEAVQAMERAVSRGEEGGAPRHAATDLEFLRWKRDFVKGLPAPRAAPAAREEGRR